MSLDAHNPVLERLAAGDFAAGWAAYTSLAQPGPQDALWAGQCLVLLGRDLEGLELLLGARHDGLEVAGALVAGAHRQGGNLERARTVLDGLDASRLGAFGHALADLERAWLALFENRPRQALPGLEAAFEFALADPLGRHFQGSIAAALCETLARLGRDERAHAVSAHALRTAHSPAQVARLRLIRAIAGSLTGRFAQAERDLKAAREGASAASHRVIAY